MENRDRLVRITFNKKPIFIPPNYRPTYKITQLVLALKICCKKQSASLIKLHFLSWSMRSKNGMTDTLAYLNGQNKNLLLWRSEPILNRALCYATAEGLISYKKGKYSLTIKGDNLVDGILLDNDLLKNEKDFLQQIGKDRLSDSNIENIYSLGRK